MSTIDKTNQQVGGVHGGARNLVVISNIINFNDNSVSAADVVQALAIGAGDVILRTTVNVTTVEGAVLTFDLGDGTDPNGYMDGVDGNVSGITGSELTLVEAAPNTISAYSGGKLYTVADTIDVVMNNDASTGIVKVSALVARMG